MLETLELRPKRAKRATGAFADNYQPLTAYQGGKAMMLSVFLKPFVSIELPYKSKCDKMQTVIISISNMFNFLKSKNAQISTMLRSS